MRGFKEKTLIMQEAEKAKFKPNAVVQVLLFLLVFIISQILAAIVPAIQLTKKIFEEDIIDLNKIMEFTTNTPQDVIISSLYCTGLATVVILIYCRFVERRSLYSMGFTKDKALLEYLKGLGIGFLMFSLAVIIAYITGSLGFNGFNSSVNFNLIFIFLGGFLIQGMSEEVIFRGYFMISLSNRTSLIIAIIINSVMFSLLHLLNPGITLLAIINIILFGVFASIYVLRTNNIWGACAIHSIWNFLQGNFYGFEVSGINTNNSILSFTALENGSLINGGSFGMEGGLAVTLVLIIFIVYNVIKNSKKQ